MLNTINLPTRRENLDSTLKRSYPFVTPSLGYTRDPQWCFNLKMIIYFYTYEGLLEDKITIKSIGVW